MKVRCCFNFPVGKLNEKVIKEGRVFFNLE